MFNSPSFKICFQTPPTPEHPLFRCFLHDTKFARLSKNSEFPLKFTFQKQVSSGISLSQILHGTLLIGQSVQGRKCKHSKSYSNVKRVQIWINFAGSNMVDVWWYRLRFVHANARKAFRSLRFDLSVNRRLLVLSQCQGESPVQGAVETSTGVELSVVLQLSDAAAQLWHSMAEVALRPGLSG